MAKSDDTSGTRSSGNPLEQPVSAETSADASGRNSNFRPPARNAWEQAIEAERVQLLHAHSVMACLYEVLLHAEVDEAVTYAGAAYVAAQLINDSVERLDVVRLRPLRGRKEGGGTPQGGGASDADELNADMVASLMVVYERAADLKRRRPSCVLVKLGYHTNNITENNMMTALVELDKARAA